jgi:hypothetical protein
MWFFAVYRGTVELLTKQVSGKKEITETRRALQAFTFSIQGKKSVHPPPPPLRGALPWKHCKK